MKTLSDIPDCYGPKPEFFVDAYAGGVGFHRLEHTTTLEGLPVFDLNSPRFHFTAITVYWVQNAFPAAMLMAAVFYEN